MNKIGKSFALLCCLSALQISAHAGFLSSYVLGVPTSTSVRSLAGAAMSGGNDESGEGVPEQGAIKSYLVVDSFDIDLSTLSDKEQSVVRTLDKGLIYTSMQAQIVLNPNESVVIKYKWKDELEREEVSSAKIAEENEVYKSGVVDFIDNSVLIKTGAVLDMKHRGFKNKILGSGFNKNEKMYRLPSIFYADNLNGDEHGEGLKISLNQDLEGLRVKNENPQSVSFVFNLSINKSAQSVEFAMTTTKKEQQLLLEEKKKSQELHTGIILFVVTILSVVFINGLGRTYSSIARETEAKKNKAKMS